VGFWKLVVSEAQDSETLVTEDPFEDIINYLTCFSQYAPPLSPCAEGRAAAHGAASSAPSSSRATSLTLTEARCGGETRSTVRTCRFPATLAALALVDTFIVVATTLRKDRDTVTRQVRTLRAGAARGQLHQGTYRSTVRQCRFSYRLSPATLNPHTQIAAEEKKKSPAGKGSDNPRLESSRQALGSLNARIQQLEGLMRQVFNGVFVQRYRDVDEHLRVECIEAVGRWCARSRTLTVPLTH
jgi:hypothetical protein